MQRIVALMLVGVLVVPPATAAQKPAKTLTWEQVQELEAGREIILTIAGGQSAKIRLLCADNAVLVTLKPTGPRLRDHVKRTLLGIGARWPAVLNAGESVLDGSVSVSKAGIFDQKQKVADLGDVVQQTARADVLSISDGRHKHTLRYVLFGVAVGFLVLSIVMGAIFGSD